MDNVNLAGRKLKLRPQEFFRTVKGVKYTGVAMLESPGDAERITRRVRRELSLSCMAIQTDRSRGLFPCKVIFIPEDDREENREKVLKIVDQEAESYFDGTEKTEHLELAQTGEQTD